MINFHWVRFQNFMLCGNSPIEIRLDSHKTTLIIGQNGVGKSTMIDAIVYCLWDQPFRPKMKKSKLINDINRCGMLCETAFSIGTKEYLVRRGMKPAIFEVHEDGRMLDQDAKINDLQAYLEKNILRCNYKTFKQVIILGAASFQPFMQLSLPERREVVEDLLDIRVFSAMNRVLKVRLDEISEEFEEMDTQFTILNKQAEVLEKYINDARRASERKAEEEIQRITTNITENQRKMDEIEAAISGLLDEVNKCLAQISDAVSVRARITKLEGYEDNFRQKIRDRKQKIKFYVDHADCDQCGRAIGDDDRHRITEEAQANIKKLEDALKKASAEIEKMQARVAEIYEVELQINDLQRAINEKRNSSSVLRQYISRLEGELKNIKVVTQIETVNEEVELEQTNQQLEELEKRKQKLTEDRHYHEIVAVLLKEGGIKTVVIRQYLPVISKLVNRYMDMMGFWASFQMDETFNEIIKRMHKDETSYAALSLGQQKRVDLSILFAWREIAKIKNSVSTNLLVLDEIADSSLDDVGIDNFMRLMQEMSADSNIFVISPKGGPLVDKFDSVIKFTTRENFSYY